MQKILTKPAAGTETPHRTASMAPLLVALGFLTLCLLIFANERLGQLLHICLKFVSPGAFIFQSPGFSLRYYGLLLIFGALAGLLCALPKAKIYQFKIEEVFSLTALSIVCGALGARLYYVALCWSHYSAHLEQILNASLGGLTIHGCLLGIALGVFLFSRINGKKFLSSLDFVCLVTPLMQSIWRWGNFFNSEAMGRPVSAALLQQMIPENSRLVGYQQYQSFEPAFFYESFWDLTIFSVIYFCLAKSLATRPGLLTCIYLGLYSLGRLLIEAIRIDSIKYGGIAVPTIVSSALLFASLIAGLWLNKYYLRKKSSK